MSSIQLADRKQVETGEYQREKPGKEQRVMHDFVRVGDKGRNRNKFLKEQEQQILSQDNIDHTVLHEFRTVNVAGIVCTILGVFRMKLKNKARGRQVGKAVPQDRQGHNKSRQRSCNANVEMLLLGNGSFFESDNGP